MFNRLNIDVGAGYIKILYGNNMAGRMSIKSYSLLKTPSDVIKNGKIQNTKVIADLIREYLSSHKYNPLSLSFVIHSSDIITKSINLPRMSRKNIVNAIKWEFEEYNNINLYKYYLGYETFNNGDNTISVQAILVPLELINQYDQISLNLHIKLLYIDLASKCLLRLIKNEDKDYIVIDNGFESIRFSIFSNKRVFAEKEFLVVDNKNAMEVIDRSKLRNVQEEIYYKAFSRMLDYFMMSRSKTHIDNIFVTGGKVLPTGFGNYIKTNYAEPVQLSNSLSMYRNSFIGEDTNYIDLFTNTIGLLKRI